MLKLRSKGGEMVKGGTYWNYGTGEKIKMKENEILPGNSSVTYLKFPPAAVPTLGLILVGVLPPYLSSLYGAFTDKIVEAYVATGMLFTVMVVGGLSFMVFRDRSALSRRTKVFTFRPDGPASETDELAPIKVQSNRIEKE